jgi:flagellar assembly protein FliH
MAKAVFRPEEIILKGDKIVLEPPTAYPDLAHLAPVEEAAEEIPDVEEYSGPTADDLRREAENFKVQWESEREAMIRSARAEADGIIKEAEAAAFQEVKRKTDEGQALKREAQDEAEKIVAEAGKKAQEIEDASRAAFEAERKDAEERGRIAGREAGFAEGKAEVERLIQRMQTVLERAQDKRAEILAETEQEIIDLVLLISRKVIKVISENQRNMVISNVVQALRKVKGRGNIIIRINMVDLKLTTEHVKDFTQLVEGSKSLQIVEDSTIDPGGCIIETDFGEIDARISSQLAELETKILEISPIKSRAKTASIIEGA